MSSPSGDPSLTYLRHLIERSIMAGGFDYSDSDDSDDDMPFLPPRPMMTKTATPQDLKTLYPFVQTQEFLLDPVRLKHTTEPTTFSFKFQISPEQYKK
jgi:hypothetical protein